MSFDEFWVPYKKHQSDCSLNYWTGCVIGAIGMAAIGFVSLWVLGAFID